MKRLLLYPFCHNLIPLVRQLAQVKEFDEIVPCVPTGFGVAGKDISGLDGGVQEGVTIRGDILQALPECDAVLFEYLDSRIEAEEYSSLMNMALDLKLEVFATGSLKKQLPPETVEAWGTAMKWLDFSSQDIPDNALLEGSLYAVNQPIVTVTGTGASCNKFVVALQLTQYFSEKGYRVLLLGTKEYSSLFGAEPLPQFLFQPLPVKEKIVRLNAYLYFLCKEKNPDIVVLGVPGGIMPINPFSFDEFGELAFVTANAVSVDANILCAYAQPFNGEFVDSLIQTCHYKFNFPTKYVAVSNYDLYIEPDTKSSKYLPVSKDYIEKEVLCPYAMESSNGSGKLFTPHSEASYKACYDDIFEELCNNIS